MALREYKLPNGILYVNTSKSVIEHIIDNGQPIEIHPGKAYLAGDIRGVPLEEYFASPDIWDAKWKVHKTIQKKGNVVVAINALGVGKFGDQILLTVLTKAYKENWGKKIKVDVVAPKKFEEIWAHNPHVDEVVTKLDENKKYDEVLDVTSLGLKFRRRKGVTCIDAILNGMGLSLINKTPVYTITKREKSWAKKRFKEAKRPLIGVSLFSAVKSRTYPHMREVVKTLEDSGHNIIILDNKVADKFVFTFREAMAVINECDLILTTDSAILHMAGALKKRVIGIFAYTEGHVFTESYEKAHIIQAPCPYGKEPCWWKIECFPGNDHLAKTNLDYAHCLKELEPDVVVEEVKRAFEEPKKLLLTMLTYNALEMTKRAMESIRSWHNYKLFVVDNKSTDGTQEWLKEKGIEFVSEEMSASAAQSVCVAKFMESDCDYLMIMNNDIVLRYDAIDRLVGCAERSGAYGVMSTPTPRPFWQMDSVVPKDNEWTEIIDIPAGSFSATLFTRECMKNMALGPMFNERFKPRYIEDNDYTLRIRLGGGKFVRAHAALFWHYLGIVVKQVEKEKKVAHNEAWDKNINIFIEMYGIHPHSPQLFERLGLEWRRDVDAKKIKNYIEEKGKARIKVERRMGGYGDILFTTVIARELRKEFGENVEVNYFIPEQFIPLLNYNPNIDGVYDYQTFWRGDFEIDLTDLEWRVEQGEMQEHGHIQSARTEIYLDILGLNKSNLKPDYFVTEEERAWAEEMWNKFIKIKRAISKEKREKRIACVHKGSNKLKCWPHIQSLVTKLWTEGYAVLSLDRNRKWSFRKAAALVATADLVISPDSGISNLAGTLDVPVVTIFSNRNGKNFSKMFKSMIPIQGHCPHREKDYCDWLAPCFGGGAHRTKENIRVPDCLEKLKVKEVYDMIKKELIK